MVQAHLVNLVLLRHGVSTANEQKRFGGWDDVPLTDAGAAQARKAGSMLKRSGFQFDRAMTSVLQRAVVSLWHCLDELGRTWIPIHQDWRLNERHYGALQGMRKADAVEQFGAARVQEWRRGYRAMPPALLEREPRDVVGDARYRHLDRSQVPLSESLRGTVHRVRQCWHEEILPSLRRGEHVLLVAHGNSIRALMMLIEGIGESAISLVEVPNAEPLIYEFDQGDETLDRRAD